HYEVGYELIDRLFTYELGLMREQAVICILIGKGRWHLDLQIACIYGLRNLGIAASSIEVIRICTYEQHEEFYSYRFAAATRTGSNWSYVCL
ncbi:MAG: laccase domain-containing protein, partial [Pseudomonadota bacterium]|nr:laccase domain-containing protein [Pseudomonadota bacterium]